MGSLMRLSELVVKYWIRGLLALFSLLVGTGIGLIIPYIVKKVIDGPLVTGNLSIINRYVAIILLAALIKGIAALIQTYCTESLAQSVVYDLRNKLYDHLQHLGFRYYDKVQTGELMSRLTADVETLRMVLGWGLINFIANMLTLLAIVLVLFTLDWKLTLVSMVVFPFAYITVRRFSEAVRPAYKALQAQIARLTSFLQENISGIRVVKAFGQEEAEIRRFGQHNRDNFARNIASSKIYAYYFPLINLLSGIGVALVLGVGGARVVNGNLSLGSLVAFNTYLAMLVAPIRMFGWVMNMIQRAGASCERIFEILDTPVEIKDDIKATELKDCKGSIEFDNVSFEHNPGRLVLENISFTIKPGEIVAVVGMTGSGKSSLANLIPRFYEPLSGAIRIDGKEIRAYTLNSLRRNIGLVMQDTFLFSASIKENIAYGRPDLNMERIRAAAAQAAIADFIEKLPGGYETQIGERGMGLSGGQKQRIALARALVLEPPIIILDDTTSSVDSETEEAIHRSLETMRGKATILIIAQRFSLVQAADKIIVLDKGKVIQEGLHNELLSREGIYREMFRMQLQ